MLRHSYEVLSKKERIIQNHSENLKRKLQIYNSFAYVECLIVISTIYGLNISLLVIRIPKTCQYKRENIRIILDMEVRLTLSRRLYVC